MKKYIFSLLFLFSFNIDSMQFCIPLKVENEEDIKVAMNLIKYIQEIKPKTQEDFERAKANFFQDLKNQELEIQCSLGNLQNVEDLLKNGADINYQEKTFCRYTCLMHATRSKNVELIKLLLKYQPDLERVNNYGDTAFMHCFKATSSSSSYSTFTLEEQLKCIKVAELLLKAGANINASNNLKRTALLNNIEDGNLEIVKFLVFNGAEFRNRDCERALSNHIEIVKFLEGYSQAKKAVNNILNKTKKIIIKKELLHNTSLHKELVDIVLDYCN